MAAFATIGAPTFAQVPATNAPAGLVSSTVPLSAIDPARLAAARPVIDQVWPLGTYQRIMRATMDQVLNGTMSSMYGMKAADLVKGTDPKAAKEAGDRTLGEMMAQNDPAYQERMRRTMRVMTDEMTALMTRMEPGVRDALASAYARRFTADQLGELRRFFATPTGRAYAADSMTLMASPEMMAQMQQFAPQMMAAMPGIMAKVEAATKDLPPATRKSQSGK
ncbi:hypothetical protein SAMN05192583_0909 [Sphingomonas gellani]|uniref:DUF2059 domain-containing protein n=2 Tax=Sphingomonas gellani TaxID=1166340 RepID=A0A1H8AJE7_9SPHN|nr:hypothetical protein SAMN05192583_0909 [Sphingomonas gellani]